MCEMCKMVEDGGASLELKVDGKTYDVGSKAGILELAVDFISKAQPELGVVIRALEDVTGGGALAGVTPEFERMTARDVAGAMILLKLVSNMAGNMDVTMRCMELSVQFANLPGAMLLAPPSGPMEHGKFSSVQLAENIRKPN